MKQPTFPYPENDSRTEASYTRLSATARLVACFAAMHMALVVDSSAHQLLSTFPRLIVTLAFSLYAAFLYWRNLRNKTAREPQIIYWIDCTWYLAITAVTGGSASHFYFFLSFPLLFVSLRWGFRPGILMTLSVTAILLVGHILFWRRSGEDLVSADILVGPSGLLALGYLMASWAQADLTLNRRLNALRDIGTLFNPRYGIEQTIDRVVRKVATLHQVTKYALVLEENGLPPRVFRADLPQALYEVSESAAQELASAASRLRSGSALVYVGRRGILSEEVFSTDLDPAIEANLLNESATLARRLDCVSFCSVRVNLRLGGAGRVVMWADGHHYNSADLAFFNQLADLLMPRMENVQLLDRLSAQAAETERQRISRDVHDSAIQPYIGLKFALEGLARKVPIENPLYADITRMVEMANSEIQKMRNFVRGLRGDEDPGHAALVPALQRQAARSAELYGIRVALESPSELLISDALAQEIFHIVNAALSNIRRHTTATEARIKLDVGANDFTLLISNPREQSDADKLFTPRSIAERAAVLGGECTVALEPPGFTTVTVRIPFRESRIAQPFVTNDQSQ